ncbi:MAG: hypothetical protein ABI641_08715 [Caldimonas sp.]
MDLAHPSTLLLPTAVALLVGWRLVSRVRRMVGRQRLSPVRPWLAVMLFPLLTALLLLTSLGHPALALALVAGTAAGTALGLYGLRLTRFEDTPLGLFYTPNAHLGIALTLLLVLRIGHRFVSMQLGSAAIGTPTADFARNPLTLLIFGTLAGYYACYAAGLIRWQRRAGGRSEG